MAQAPPKPVLFEGDLLGLWTDAQRQFQCATKLQENGHMFEEALREPSRWPEILRGMPKKSDHFEKACNSVGRHIERIQMAIEITSSTFQLVAAAVPVVTPATICVQAFALVFQTFAAVHKELERIETFFEDMAQLFKDISMLSGYLHGDLRLGILRERITEIFSCSLKICASAIEDHDGRFKKWLKVLKGDTELDRLLADMSAAKEHLFRCIDFATYAEMKRAGHNIEAIEKRGNQEDRNDILDWLSPLDFETRHTELLNQVKGRPNAGRWLLDSESFQEWKNTSCSKLWYTGKPGAGKSVLASIIIRHLQNTMVATRDEHEPVVAFLYMSHKTSPTVAELLGSIVRQIVADMPFVPNEVEVEWKKITGRGKSYGRYRPANEDTLKAMLTKLTARRPFYIVLDAMDECKLDIRKPLLNALKSITEDVRILVTARLLEKRDELSEGFDKMPIKAQNSDVDEYIEFMISEDSELRNCSGDDIKRTVRRKAGGMFLLVRLHMHALSNLDGRAEIADALANLPKTVDESYANAIARVNTKDPLRKFLARVILAWMSYTFRPLKFQELSHAIATQTSGPIIEKHRLLSKERITSVCCGLVEIDMDDIVRFVHYSAQSFFVQRKESEFGASRLDIPLACAKYLCMDVLEQPVDSKDSEESIEHRPNSEKLESYPFAEYAAEHLHKHFQLVRNENDRTEKHVELDRYIRRLVNEEPKRNFYCNLLRDLQAYYTHSVVLEGRYGESHGNVDATPLHLAVFLGSRDLVQSLLDRPNSNVNELDGSEQTPLVIAFKRDFGDIAEMLLDHGATVDLSSKQGHVLLLYAAQRNHEKAVGKILKSLKETELPWSLFDLGVLLVAPLILILCFLHKTLTKSDGSTIPAQPPSEKDTHIPDDQEMDPLLKRYGRALILAYEGRSHALDEFLAIHPFDVDDCDHEDQVSRSDSWDSSSSGVSSNKYGGIRAQDFLNTACFLAVEGGHTSTVEVLLNRGVSADLKNSHGQPLLHRATFRNNIGLVELILDKGATMDLEDENQRTAFTAHASIEREEVLRFLQSKGANINHTGEYGVHELYRAAAFGNIEMVQFFLDAGVSASITNIFSWAPLHEASANGHLECVRLLFNKGAHPSPISDVGKTPLDLINSGQLHYDWPCLGKDSEHYLNGEVYKKKEEDLQDIERKEQIRDLLLEKGAKTADELYAEDRSQFDHVSYSYLPESTRYESDYESD